MIGNGMFEDFFEHRQVKPRMDKGRALVWGVGLSVGIWALIVAGGLQVYLHKVSSR